MTVPRETLVQLGAVVREVGSKRVGKITGMTQMFDEPVKYLVQWAVSEPSQLCERSQFRVQRAKKDP